MITWGMENFHVISNFSCGQDDIKKPFTPRLLRYEYKKLSFRISFQLFSVCVPQDVSIESMVYFYEYPHTINVVMDLSGTPAYMLYPYQNLLTFRFYQTSWILSKGM